MSTTLADGEVGPNSVTELLLKGGAEFYGDCEDTTLSGQRIAG
jgi:hypothetical protein